MAKTRAERQATREAKQKQLAEIEQLRTQLAAAEGAERESLARRLAYLTRVSSGQEARRTYLGMPEPMGPGNFHHDARLVLVPAEKPTWVTVGKEVTPDGDEKDIRIPILAKEELVAWVWDGRSKRWLTGEEVAVVPEEGERRFTHRVKRTRGPGDPLRWASNLEEQINERQRAASSQLREERLEARRGFSRQQVESLNPATFALSLPPHWAHATTWLGRRIEVRDFAPEPTLLGKAIALHASARLPDDWIEQLQVVGQLAPFRAGTLRGTPIASLQSDPVDRPVRTGQIVAVATLADVTLADGGKYVWHWSSVIPVVGPKVRGQLGLWPLLPDIQRLVQEAKLRTAQRRVRASSSDRG